MGRCISLLIGMILATGCGTTPVAPRPFALRVIDAETGRGVPLVELTTVSRVRYWTDSAGYAAIDDPALLGRRAFFHVASHGYEYPADGFDQRGSAVELTPGGAATLTLPRANIAERLYRVTGEGIYRDSVVLRKPTPIRQPLLNGQVAGQDSVRTTVYRGKLWWFWGDTNRPSYPLGHFSTAGATSELPGRGGLDPAVGVDLDYFVDGDGFSRPMVPAVPGQFHWIDGLTVLPDEAGRARMLANLTRRDGRGELIGLALIAFDDERGTFEVLKELDPKTPFRLTGNPFRHVVDGVEYLYCGGSFPNIRVRADWRSVVDPAAYEGYSPSPRDAEGRVTWAWRRNVPAVDVEGMDERVKSGGLKAEQLPLRLHDVASKRPIEAHAWSVCWNAFRRRWVMIVVERGGAASYLGEVWYVEAEAPEGPWREARQVLTHDRYSFYNPIQHPEFQREGGRFIYFEGTFATTFSRENDPTPRYEYNQIMYRLDLSDQRLNLPRQDDD